MPSLIEVYRCIPFSFGYQDDNFDYLYTIWALSETWRGQQVNLEKMQSENMYDPYSMRSARNLFRLHKYNEETKT